ncbi:MAG: hypothetical protein H0X33_11160 [Taibaiella sp.]|nr:hypothetical protein [Taibaiella sp.]
MNNTNNQAIVDNVVDAQKQTVDTVVENSKKFTNGNTMVNETIEKGSEWYKNWLDTQKSVFNRTAGQAAQAEETAKDSTTKMNDFYQNWLNNQMNFGKQMFDMNQNWTKNATQGNAANANPMNQMNNWMNQMNQMNSFMGNAAQGANWMNQMNQWQNMNPFKMDSFKQPNDMLTGFFNQYSSILNNSFADWQKNFQNGTVQDAYRGMVNVSEGFTRFAEMWAPMWKSIQEKTFNADMYKQYMNPEMYKDMMDKYFGFLPESSRQYMQNATNMFNDNMKQNGNMGTDAYQQMRQMFQNNGFDGNAMFGNMLSGYNSMYNSFNNAVSPITKMMTPNKDTKNMMEWSDIANRMVIYNIKNSEMQYMIYTQGIKVMDQLAENVAKKVKDGTEVNSMMAMYQEWLNISDKVYVSLFESDEYSVMMAEVSAMQLKLRKDIELQMEKMMTGIPVATRSEMDEIYKTIYDLKKQVRELEKALEAKNTASTPAPSKAKVTPAEEAAARRTKK